MKNLVLGVLCLNLICCGGQTITYKEISERTEQSKDVVKEFGQLLKGKLQTAMKAGGPINALTICKQDAPKIAKQLSDKYGWDIHRTSLKPRATQPDAWEKKIMQGFEKQHADGDGFKYLFSQDIVAVNGKATFRFMQAIETKGVCLACHGENIAPEVAEKIAQLYPNDQAIGFKLGDIRGAFSIIQPLDKQLTIHH